MTSNRTLGEWVIEYPAAARIFHRHGLDFCCGGNQLLEQACADKGLDFRKVSDEIASATISLKEVRWDRQPVEALVQYILDRYHKPLKTEFPRLMDLSRKVERVHGGKPECPIGLAAVLAEVEAALERHLAKEEQILFPLILSGDWQSAQKPIQIMKQEHADHGETLQQIRKIALSKGLPASACASWRELYRSLESLETDLMDHIHLENNILFAGAIAGL